MGRPRRFTEHFLARLAGLCVLAVLISTAAGSIGAADEVLPAGHLEITAAVVTRDLEIRPVPKFRVRVLGHNAELAPGNYRALSAEPLDWEQEELTWVVPFAVAPGSVTRLELSRDNAQRRELPRAGRVSREAELYRTLSSSVFLVSADAGVGSGFLVDDAGLILTNYHVVAKARYVALLVARGRKVPATVVAADSEKDLAVLRVHPESVRGLPEFSLLSDPSGLVVGERVLAIGNPLDQESVLTSGIVSKLDANTLISDVNINPGNSGGPLLNLDGVVVGINTFSLQGGSGPGVSGTLRVHVAATSLEEAREALGSTPPPPFDLLPTVPETRFAPDRLRAMLTANPNTSLYEIEAGPFDVTVFTPPLLHSLSLADELRAAERQKKRLAKKRKKHKNEPIEVATFDGIEVHGPSELMFDWAEQSGVFDAVVIVRAMPEVAMTGGSKAGRILGALAGVITPATYRFKSDFREMRLLRDGEALRPIHPGRVCETVSMHRSYGQIEDVGCYGQYLYDPAEFRTGTRFTLEIYSEDGPEATSIVALGSTMIAQIRSDFSPYFESTQPAADEEPSADKVDPDCVEERTAQSMCWDD